jgi:hypothetical protein
MTEREKEIYIATKQGDMCVNVVAVIAELVQQMLDYCKEHNIKIDRIEKRNWEFLIKTAKQLESMSYNLSKEQKIIFDRNTKMFSLLMRLILARVDDADMKLYQWYNYIKTFPADLPEVQPSGAEEAEVFKHLFT